ncbi:MAG: porin family protein [Bacteroidota bacterium]
MKKSFIIASILTVTLGMSVQAQDSPRESVSFGLKVGANYSNVWDKQGQDFQADGKFGFAGGLFVGIPFSELLGFQPELMISQKGMQASGTLFGTAYSNKRTTTYLDVPLQLQIKPADFLTVVVGPQYSFLLHEKNVYTFGSNSIEQEQEFENDNVRKNVLGFVAGVDVMVSHFVISGRTSFDFLNNNGDGSSVTPRYKNLLVQLTVGYKF